MSIDQLFFNSRYEFIWKWPEQSRRHFLPLPHFRIKKNLKGNFYNVLRISMKYFNNLCFLHECERSYQFPTIHTQQIGNIYRVQFAGKCLIQLTYQFDNSIIFSDAFVLSTTINPARIIVCDNLIFIFSVSLGHLN